MKKSTILFLVAIINLMLAGICAGQTLDLNFTTKESVAGFNCTEGKIRWGKDALVCKYRRGSALLSPDLRTGTNSRYCPPLGNALEQRNTFFVVMSNRSRASRVLLRWRTDVAVGSKEFEIEPGSRMKAYYFNISDCPECRGKLMDFSLEFVGRRGKCHIDQIRFEHEQPIVEYAGSIASCVADSSSVHILGTVEPALAKEYSLLSVYEYPFHQENKPLRDLKLLYEGRVSESFDIDAIPNSRLNGRMTHLSTRFLAVVRKPGGDWLPLSEPFHISNWRDFCENPYSFALPEARFNVMDFGAKGNGFSDDTEAIQRAIDACSEAGGGHVDLCGDASPTGRRYVATHLVLRSNVDFHICEGAVLWQSYDVRHYAYEPAFGHDFEIPGCPWTHSLFINFPLLQGNDINHVKISGTGTIRMADNYSLNPDIHNYANFCSERIHICPVAISNSSWIEFTDVEIVRSNNYHTNFATDDHLFIGNVKCYDVQCVSGDGFGFSQGTRHVRVARVFFDSNDDGIVLCSSFKDPRGKICAWRHDNDSSDHSVRDISVMHSYINSATKGAGKAIALIPWGSTNPDQSKQELDSVIVVDCVLRGGHSVGTWCDNPFDGKPFDNMEEGDYAPVKNFRLLGNDYQSPCDLLSIKPTNFLTDCGLHSASGFVNGDFSEGLSYWTCSGNVHVSDGVGSASDGGSLHEGLYVRPGNHVLAAEVSGNGILEVRETLSGNILAQKEISADEVRGVLLPFSIHVDTDCLIGVRAARSGTIRCHQMSLR